MGISCASNCCGDQPSISAGISIASIRIQPIRLAGLRTLSNDRETGALPHSTVSPFCLSGSGLEPHQASRRQWILRSVAEDRRFGQPGGQAQVIAVAKNVRLSDRVLEAMVDSFRAATGRATGRANDLEPGKTALSSSRARSHSSRFPNSRRSICLRLARM